MNQVPCNCPVCVPQVTTCGCPFCTGAVQRVYRQAGGGVVAVNFMNQAMAMGYEVAPPGYNDLAEAAGSRFLMVPSDDLPDLPPEERTNIAAAMSYMAARFSQSPAVTQMMAYKAMQIRLFTSQPPAQFWSGGPVSSGSGYTSGGIPQSPQPPSWNPSFPLARPAPPPGVTPGIPGFSEAGRLTVSEPESELEIPDSFEPVRGYRWWSLEPAPTDKAPLDADRIWRKDPLRGARSPWTPGENRAVCMAAQVPDAVHSPNLIPLLECGCGFWAYWQIQHYDLSSTAYPVCGVVDGYGPVIIGEKGFRAAKAKIVAVALPFTLVPVSAARRIKGSPWSQAGFQGKVHYVGMDDPDKHRENYESFRAAEEAEARDRADAEAWMGIISDRIATMYPGVRVFETVAALMATYPPDKTYGPAEQPCPNCGERSPDLYQHLIVCGINKGFTLD